MCRLRIIFRPRSLANNIVFTRALHLVMMRFGISPVYENARKGTQERAVAFHCITGTILHGRVSAHFG